MATNLQLAGRMVTLGAGAARAPTLLKMVVDDDRGLVATGCPPARCWGRTAILAIGGRTDQHGARPRLELAVKDEVAFWRRLEERNGNVE
jgi:hypothetical protein